MNQLREEDCILCSINQSVIFSSSSWFNAGLLLNTNSATPLYVFLMWACLKAIRQFLLTTFNASFWFIPIITPLKKSILTCHFSHLYAINGTPLVDAVIAFAAKNYSLSLGNFGKLHAVLQELFSISLRALKTCCSIANLKLCTSLQSLSNQWLWEKEVESSTHVDAYNVNIRLSTALIKYLLRLGGPDCQQVIAINNRVLLLFSWT